jgi:hypothetical protein
VLLALLVLTSGATTTGDWQPLAPRAQATNLFKALLWDRSLPQPLKTLRLAIFYEPLDPTSTSWANDMLLAFEDLSKALSCRLSLEVRLLEAGDEKTLRRRLEEMAPDVVYVCPGTEGKIPLLLEMMHAQHIRGITGFADLVEQGIPLGVVEAEGRLRLLVHLASARASGMRPDPRLLRLARVLGVPEEEENRGHRDSSAAETGHWHARRCPPHCREETSSS